MRIVSPLLAALLAVGVSHAGADPSSVSRLGWVTNGEVRTAVQVGSTLYVGGTFTRVAPSSGALGSFFALSTTTGEPSPQLPLVDGVVNAIEPDGAGGYYIGGAFTTVGGVPRTSIARVLADGSVDSAFAPVIETDFGSGTVLSMRRGAAHLFVGGDFSRVNGQYRERFAALNPTNGSPVSFSVPVTAFPREILVAGANVIILASLSNGPQHIVSVNQTTAATVWSTTVDGRVNAMVLAGSRVILGGQNLFPGNRVVLSLDVATGATDTTWVPGGASSGATDSVVSLTVSASGATLYAGGSFTNFGGQPRANLAAVEIAVGTVANWAPTTDAAVTSIANSAGAGVLIGGRFKHVNGDSREAFAELDGNGGLSSWVANAYAANVRSLKLVGDTLAVGGDLGVTGGVSRTNLAAFDLASDALLSWAPVTSDDVTNLAAIDDSIYVGASRPVTAFRHDLVFAVHRLSGALLPWSPATAGGTVLVGTHGSHVYVDQSPAGVRRLDSVSGVADASWAPAVHASHMLVSGNTIFLGGSSGLLAVDLATGTVSLWYPDLGRPPIPCRCNERVAGLSTDGGTLYVAVVRTMSGILTGSATAEVVGFDLATGLPIKWKTAFKPGPTLFGNIIEAIGVADGQVIVAHDLLTFFPPLPFTPSRAGLAVAAYAADGSRLTWNPGLNRNETTPSIPKSRGVIVTPTDVIVLGYNSAGSVPVQGIGVFSRTPSAAPTGLRGAAIGNQVTLTWTPPATPPTSGYVVEVASESASSAPVSIPTGSQATSISGPAGDGTYFIRVRSAGVLSEPEKVPTNEIALIVGCALPSAPPLGLVVQVEGSHVRLSWIAPPFSLIPVREYLLEVGSSAGASDIIASLSLPPSQLAIDGDLPPRTYFVRLRSSNACGTTAASSEVYFTVGAAESIPSPPFSPMVDVVGTSVGFRWNVVPGAVQYVLEVGSLPGLSDLARIPLSTTAFSVDGVPRGTYYARVRAGNAAGLGSPSEERKIVVTQ